MTDTAQTISLPPLRLQRAREQLWNDLTDSDPQAAHQMYATLMAAVSEPGALLSIQSVARTRLLEVLFRVVTVLRALRWGLYPALVCAGLMVRPWFLVGAPLVFLLDRAVLGYWQVRFAVDLAARVQVFNDLTLEGIEPFPPEPSWPESEPFPPLDRRARFLYPGADAPSRRATKNRGSWRGAFCHCERSEAISTARR